jgi:hypothetical protein
VLFTKISLAFERERKNSAANLFERLPPLDGGYGYIGKRPLKIV